MTGRYGWLPDLPDHRDILYKISQPRKLPASADLRSALPAPWDQGQLGSCTGNATAAALAYGRAMQSLPFIVPSRLMLYYNARALEGTTATDVGAQIRDAIKAAADLGACSEDLWPYDEAQFATPPDQAAVAAALKDRAVGYRRVPQDMTSIRTCLAEGDPIVFGFSVYDSFEGSAVAFSGKLDLPTQSESMIGGHAVLAVGYDDTERTLLVRNSWGTDWGMSGHFTMPYDYISNPSLADDLWTIRLVTP
jgi:C1A family cysteine protease